jgi:ribosome-associated translation inhibitor RaiA
LPAPGPEDQQAREHREQAGEGFPLTVVSDERVPEEAIERARELLSRVTALSARPVLHARLVLHVQPDPALERPAIAKASLDVNGRSVRAHASAPRMLDAVDLLAERLRRNLEDLDETARAHRHETGTPPPGEWRHGSLPGHRPRRRRS